MTPRGRVSASWSRSPWLKGDGPARHGAPFAGGEFRLSLSLPDGVIAELEIPYGDLGRELREGGTTVWSVQEETAGTAVGSAAGSAASPGLGRVERRGGILAVEAGSGDYEFILKW